MKFSPAQRAQGILTTFSQGNYSLAVARIREVDVKDRQKVLDLVTKALTREERDILKRYARDLF